MAAYFFSWQGGLDILWFIFLLILFVHFWRIRRTNLKTKQWMQTQGQIVRCEWVFHGHRTWPKLEYAYNVDGEHYLGETIFLDTAHHNPNSKKARSIAFNIAEAQKENKALSVYYDPTNPKRAALDISMPRKLTLILAIIAFFIGLHGTIILFHLFR